MTVRPGRWLALLTVTFAADVAVAQLAPAQTPAEAYQRGCASCHGSESRVLRAIPRGDEATRRTWIVSFMARHPCERDDLKALIVQYLLERTRP